MGVPVGFRCGIPFMERDGVSALGEFDADGIGCAFVGIIFQKLGAQAASLDTDHGIDRRVKIRGAAKLLCSNLVFLYGSAGVFDGVVSEITQELTQRLGTMEDGTGGNLLHLA